MLITTNAQLREFVQRASSRDVVAIDTEFMREKTYRPQLCLVQLGTDDEQVAVDPFAIHDTTPLVELFRNKRVTKVFHSCSQDMEVLLDYCGELPRPLFDTQIAASFIGDRFQIGYGALVEEYCKVSLPKTESMTDWTRRPLDAAQIEYALDDVRYLPRIWRMMTRRLEEQGRTSWVADEFRRVSEPELYRHDPREAFWRLKRLGALSRKQLSVAREVAQWREERASKLDRPRRWILQDEIVVDIAKRCPTSVGSLLKVRGAGELSASDQRAIVEAVQRGLDCPPEDCPKPERHEKPTFDEECVCDMMFALTRVVANQHALAPSVLASREDLMAYLVDKSSSPVASGWRREVLGKHLDDLLAGKVGLTVHEGRLVLL